MILAGYPVSELPPTQASLFLLAGFGSMTIAVLGRKFYWLKGWGAGDKPAPLWFGRIMFGTLGIVFFLVGAYNLCFR